jgi:Rrf2 family nitric oxide-sensitive transcriptional repressor
MFSNTAEYALRAVVHLAAATEQACTTGEIAEATQVPAGYLSKVLQNLGRAGLVTAQRGPTGGFTLSRSPESITVLNVVNAVDPIQRITKCPLNIPSHAVKLCKLHARLDHAIALVERALGESTIAEMIETAPKRAQRVAATVGRKSIPVAPGATRKRGEKRM